MAEFEISTLHRRRLREIWRSAGWPCQDLVEVELLAARLLERLRDGQGRETLRVTERGIQVLVDTLHRNRAARGPHEALVQHVARGLARAGRIVWCGLSLRARVAPAGEAAGAAPASPTRRPAGSPPPVASLFGPTGDESVPAGPDGHRWQTAVPDIYSVRHTTVAGYLQPVVHEIKVRRADLLADLRLGSKRAAYLDVAGECWYVLREGIAEADEVPAECGVLLARGADGLGALEVLRPAPRRAMPFEAGLPFSVWMALARATPLAAPDDDQQLLGDTPQRAGMLLDPLGSPADRTLP
jgi:hypothetical protein